MLLFRVGVEISQSMRNQAIKFGVSQIEVIELSDVFAL
jgi:hypothetical protein